MISRNSSGTSVELRSVLECLLRHDGPDIDPVELSALLSEDCRSGQDGLAADVPTSWHKWQDPVIEELIPRCSRILDLGCGDGQLLAHLLARGDVCGQGLELDQAAVMNCIAKGVPVFHGDLDTGKLEFPDHAFDVVILEETLQTLRKPTEILAEMLRVGHTGIVSFPNFANLRVRRVFAAGGRMPVTPSLPNQWYDTPNIHLCSIRDFVDWTAKAGVEVVDVRVLCEGQVRSLCPGDNLYAEEALFLLRRDKQS